MAAKGSQSADVLGGLAQEDAGTARVTAAAGNVLRGLGLTEMLTE